MILRSTHLPRPPDLHHPQAYLVLTLLICAPRSASAPPPSNQSPGGSCQLINTPFAWRLTPSTPPHPTLSTPNAGGNCSYSLHASSCTAPPTKPLPPLRNLTGGRPSSEPASGSNSSTSPHPPHAAHSRPPPPTHPRTAREPNGP